MEHPEVLILGLLDAVVAVPHDDVVGVDRCNRLCVARFDRSEDPIRHVIDSAHPAKLANGTRNDRSATRSGFRHSCAQMLGTTG